MFLFATVLHVTTVTKMQHCRKKGFLVLVGFLGALPQIKTHSVNPSHLRACIQFEFYPYLCKMIKSNKSGTRGGMRLNSGRKTLGLTERKFQLIGSCYISESELKALGYENISAAKAAANQAVKNLFSID